MSERKVASGAAQIHTEAFGDPGAPPLLLIMGATASMLWWPDGFVEGLAASGRYVIRYDNRDTGLSSWWPPGPPPYRFDDLADDALAVLDAYGIDRAPIVGMSMGGLIGQILAVRDPGRVAALVTIGAPYFGPAAPLQATIDPAIMIEVGKARSINWTDLAAVENYVVTLWRLNGGRGRPFEEDRVRGIARRELARAPSPASMFNHTLLKGAEPFFNRAAEIRMPVLAIQGTRDPVVAPAHGRAIANNVADGRLMLLEGAGHDLHSSDWPAMTQAILEHVAAT